MVALQPVKKLLPVAVMSCFWSTWVVVQMLWSLVTKGPRAFFGGPLRKERPGILNDKSLGEHHFVKLKTGVRLHYVATGPTDKPLMLFLHGFPEFWFSWRFQIKKFSGDYRTVAVDMRGYGESDKPRGISNYHLSLLGADIKELILELGYKECVLVAHDWGGYVAQSVALSYPEVVSRLILSNIPHRRAMQKHLEENKTQLLMSWYVFFFQMPFLPEIFLSAFDFKWISDIFAHKSKGASRAPCTEEEAEAYRYSIAQPGSTTATINYYRALIRYEPVPHPSHQVKVPTLMVWGTQDMALGTALAEKSAAYFDQFTLKLIESSGHWVQMEEPDLVNQHIQEWLNNK